MGGGRGVWALAVTAVVLVALAGAAEAAIVNESPLLAEPGSKTLEILWKKPFFGEPLDIDAKRELILWTRGSTVNLTDLNGTILWSVNLNDAASLKLIGTMHGFWAASGAIGSDFVAIGGQWLFIFHMNGTLWWYNGTSRSETIAKYSYEPSFERIRVAGDRIYGVREDVGLVAFTKDGKLVFQNKSVSGRLMLAKDGVMVGNSVYDFNGIFKEYRRGITESDTDFTGDFDLWKNFTFTLYDHAGSSLWSKKLGAAEGIIGSDEIYINDKRILLYSYKWSLDAYNLNGELLWSFKAPRKFVIDDDLLVLEDDSRDLNLTLLRIHDKQLLKAAPERVAPERSPSTSPPPLRPPPSPLPSQPAFEMWLAASALILWTVVRRKR